MLAIISAFLAGALFIIATESLIEGEKKSAIFYGLVSIWNTVNAVLIMIVKGSIGW